MVTRTSVGERTGLNAVDVELDAVRRERDGVRCRTAGLAQPGREPLEVPFDAAGQPQRDES
jgi:hypothetical protein